MFESMKWKQVSWPFKWAIGGVYIDKYFKNIVIGSFKEVSNVHIFLNILSNFTAQEKYSCWSLTLF